MISRPTLRRSSGSKATSRKCLCSGCTGRCEFSFCACRGGFALSRRAAFTPTCFTSSSHCCCCCCSPYETRSSLFPADERGFFRPSICGKPVTMKPFLPILMQTILLLALAPLLGGLIKNWKAKLQNRRGPRIWQPYFDLLKFLRKDMVISEHASWIFSLTPYVLFLTALSAGLMVPMVTAQAPMSLFGGALALVGLMALGRFFLALAGLDPASAFGGMGSSREMTISAIAEPAMMLAIFTVAISAGSTNLSQIVIASQQPGWRVLDPSRALAFAAMFIVLLAETGRIPIDNPATHLELTMIHEAMLLEYSSRYLALIEWGASIKQLVLMALLANIFFPIGLAADTTIAAFGLGLIFFVGKLIVISGAVVWVETTNAKLRLFRVPDLLSAAFILATLALVSTFLFR